MLDPDSQETQNQDMPTLGAPRLYLAVDHKPLVRILGDKCLQDIDNPRLLCLKEKTLRYRFTCIHVPGSEHKGADFRSRNPSSLEFGQDVDMSVELACMTHEYEVHTQGIRNRPFRYFLAGIRAELDETDIRITEEVEHRTVGIVMSSIAELVTDQ